MEDRAIAHVYRLVGEMSSPYIGCAFFILAKNRASFPEVSNALHDAPIQNDSLLDCLNIDRPVVPCLLSLSV